MLDRLTLDQLRVHDARPRPLPGLVLQLREAGVVHVHQHEVGVGRELLRMVAHERVEQHQREVGTDDDGNGQSDAWFDAGVSAILGALADFNRKVIVHCHMGVNRGPSLAFAAMLALGHEPTEALAAIKARFPELPVLILSGFPEAHYATTLLRQGASGYLNKECDPEEIVKAILLALLKRDSSAHAALTVAEAQKEIGLFLKYKSYVT